MPKNRSNLIMFLFGLAVLHGLIVNLMPVMFTTMEETFGADKARQALLKSYFFGGSAIALVFSGYLTLYLGVRWMCVLLGTVAGSGAILFGLAPSYSLVLVGAAVLAIGTSPLVAVYASLINSEFHDVCQRMYMWTFALMAVSATIATTALGWLLDTVGDYRPIFIGLGIFIWCSIAILLAINWRALAPAKTLVPKMPANPTDPIAKSKLAAIHSFFISGVFTRGALYLMGLLMIFDYLCVSNMMAWTPTFFEELYGGRKVLGGSALSASSAGVAVGRIVMGTLPPGKIPDRLLLAGCYIGGVICFGLMVSLQSTYLVSMALMFLSGAFISAQAPTMASLAIAKFGDRAPVAIPIYEAIGTLAGIVGPPALGYLADRTGQLSSVLMLVPVAGLTLAAIAVVWEIADRRQIEPIASQEPE